VWTCTPEKSWSFLGVSFTKNVHPFKEAKKKDVLLGISPTNSGDSRFNPKQGHQTISLNLKQSQMTHLAMGPKPLFTHNNYQWDFHWENPAFIIRPRLLGSTSIRRVLSMSMRSVSRRSTEVSLPR
jgi:hypothetical protein